MEDVRIMLQDVAKLELDAETALIFGIITTALIAIVSILGTIWVARSAATASSVAKIAEFRQAWINELRNCLAEFQALGTTPGHEADQDSSFYRLGTKIELLMNPNDPDFPALKDVMYRYLAASDMSVLEKYRINPEFVNVSQRILKREWDRLKADVKHKRI